MIRLMSVLDQAITKCMNSYNSITLQSPHQLVQFLKVLIVN